MVVKIIRYSPEYLKGTINVYYQSTKQHQLYPLLKLSEKNKYLFCKHVVENSLLSSAIIAIDNNIVIGISLIDDWISYRSRKSFILDDKDWNIIRHFYKTLLDRAENYIELIDINRKDVCYGTFSGVLAEYSTDNVFSRMTIDQLPLLLENNFKYMIGVATHPATSKFHLKLIQAKVATPIYAFYCEDYKYEDIYPFANPLKKKVPVRLTYFNLTGETSPLNSKL